jgi:hypothetical protein
LKGASPLLDILHTKTKADIHVGGITANPHSKIPTYDITNLEQILQDTRPQTILLQNDTEPTPKITRMIRKYPLHTVYVLTPQSKLDTNTKSFIIIRKTQVAILPSNFWRGYHTGLTYATQDWALTYPTEAEPKIPQLIDYSTLTIPPYIKGLLNSTDEIAIAFLSGGVSMPILQTMRDFGIPEKYLRKLYKTLGKTLIEHQHEQWLERNAQVPHTKTYKAHKNNKQTTKIGHNNPNEKKTTLKKRTQTQPKKKQKTKQTTKASPTTTIIDLSDDEILPPGPPPKELQVIHNQIKQMCQPLPIEEENKLKQYLALKEGAHSIHNMKQVIISGREIVHRIDAAILTREHLHGKYTASERKARYIKDNILDAFLNQTANRAVNGNHRVLCISALLKATKNHPKETWKLLNKRKTKIWT